MAILSPMAGEGGGVRRVHESDVGDDGELAVLPENIDLSLSRDRDITLDKASSGIF
jgi:hypothetical protein